MVRPGFKQTEIGPLPHDWKLPLLSSIADVRDGTHDSPKYQQEGIPLVTSKNIIDGQLDLSNVSYISEQDAINIDKRSKVDCGDILMSMIGTIGNAVLVNSEPNFCIKNVALIKPKSIDQEFLVQLINSPKFQNYLQNKLEGGIQQFISLGTLRKLSILFPKEDEQKAIAAALGDVDALIGSLDRLIAKKRALKTAAMQQLLTGRTRLPGFGEGKGYQKTEAGVIPEDWDVNKIGDICAQSKKRINPILSTTDYRCVELEHIASETGVLLGYFNSRTQLSLKSFFSEGDVLFGKLRPYLKKYYYANFTGVCSTEFWVLKAAQRINSKFLYYLIQSERFLESANQSTGTKMPRAEWNLVSKLLVPLPPTIEEQCAIAGVLSDMDGEIGALERRRDKVKAIKEGMMQELLTGRTRLI